MRAILIYADDADFEVIRELLNADDEVAFIVSNGDKKWIARSQTDKLLRGTNTLWHVPSGPLPLISPKFGEPDSIIDNPWCGWTELKTGANPWYPYFGAGHPGIITLDVSRQTTDRIGLSGFDWIANYYKDIGIAAHPATEKWWGKLRRWIKKQAVTIPETGPFDGLCPSVARVWTFPSALKKIKDGLPRGKAELY